jgi:DNA-binding NarL/FixJ family response regulator
MSTSIRVAVIDDHPLFREGVTRSLSEIEGFEIVAQGSSGEDAVRIAGTVRPDILLMDISMPAGGLDAIPSVLAVAPSQKIVMLTVSETSEDVITALDRGAMGYVLKGVGARTLADAIRTIAAGEGYVAPTLSARLFPPAPRRRSKANRRSSQA